MNLCELLAEIPRTGWVRRGVPDAEDDLRHTGGMIEETLRLAQRLPELDHDRICQCIFVHELPEAIDGFDQVTADLPDGVRERVRSEKQAREIANMQRWCAALGEVGDFIFEAYLDFELKRTAEGRFAYEMDKFQTMKQAWSFECQHFNVRAMDFIEHDRAIITHSVLLEELAKLEAEIAAARLNK